jgi:hypothetical protein
VTFLSLVEDNIVDFQVDHVLFRPGLPVPEFYFNTFIGFKADEVSEYDISKFAIVLNHIKQVMVAGNEKSYNYVLDWFAYIIQKPHEKNRSALIFISSYHGAGKNALTTFIINKIIGEAYGTTTNKLQHIVGNFNNTAEDKLLTVLDECDDTGNSSREWNETWNTFKNIITEKTQQVTNKHKDTRTFECYNNFVFLSNHANPIKLEAGDRRYFVAKCDGSKVNEDYVNKLVNILLYDTECADHFYTFLRKRNITQYHPEFTMPITSVKRKMLLDTTPSVHKFIIEFVRHGQQVIIEAKKKAIPKETLYAHYESYCRLYDLKSEKVTKFKDLLDDLSITIKCIGREKIECFIIDNIKGVQDSFKHAYKFKEIDEYYSVYDNDPINVYVSDFK